MQQRGFPERPWTLVSHHLASTSLGTTFRTDTPIRCLDLSPFLRLECAFSDPGVNTRFSLSFDLNKLKTSSILPR